MDGIHDLGGRQGFGPIDVAEADEPFHHRWEARLFGITRAMARPADWSIDWFRHCRELIDPADYLTRPYFDQWLQTYAAMLINSGVATVEEVAGGRAVNKQTRLPPPMAPEHVGAATKAVVRYDRDGVDPPAFAVGDRVRAKVDGAPGHTRLPAYVRGRPGRIEALHGAHVFPDANALGNAQAEPLYGVAFRARDLWPDAGGGDRVHLDLWESYLERA